MNLSLLLKNYFTADINFEDKLSYRRVVMINSVLTLLVVSFSLFTYINLFITQDYIIATLDFIAGLMSLFILWLFRQYKDIRQVAFLATIILITFMILFIIKNNNSHFGVIWSVFIPYFAITFNGKKVGLYLSMFYYGIMFILAYEGLGVWNEGMWEFIDLFRFVVASTVLTFVVYITESAHEHADKELAIVREHEQAMLEELTQLAITDALTGVYNRRYFNETFPLILEDAKETESLTALLILDIDYFKDYNDKYGHFAGDIALRKVAQKLSAILQNQGSLVFRIGGEEFAAVMHVKSEDEVEEIVNNIHQGIHELNIEHNASKLSSKILTISIGVCTNYPTDDKQLDYFYKTADTALYQAKYEGRNRTIFAK